MQVIKCALWPAFLRNALGMVRDQSHLVVTECEVTSTPSQQFGNGQKNLLGLDSSVSASSGGWRGTLKLAKEADDALAVQGSLVSGSCQGSTLRGIVIATVQCYKNCKLL